MKNQIYLLFLSLFFCVNVAFGQSSSWGVTGQMGVSSYIQTISTTFEFKYQPLFSSNWGLFYKKRIFKNTHLVTNLELVQIASQYVGEDVELYGPFFIGTLEQSYSKRYEAHIALPILLEQNFGKFSINAGIQPMMFVYGRYHNISQGIINNLPYNVNRWDNMDYVPHFLELSFRAGMNYPVHPKMNLSASFYREQWIFTKENYIRQTRRWQAVAGIQYIINEK